MPSFAENNLGFKFYDFDSTIAPKTIPEFLKKLAATREVSGKRAYLANPMSSWGALVLFRKRYPDQDLSAFTQEIIEQNNRFAQINSNLVAEYIPEELEEHILILPNRMGAVRGFGSLEYMLGCFTMIPGFDYDTAMRFTEPVLQGKIVDRETFNNHSQGEQARVESQIQHRKLADYCADFYAGLTALTSKISKILAVAGHEHSNGTDAELMLGTLLDIPIKRITYDPHHPDFQTKVLDAAPWLQYYEDSSHLSPNGGEKLIYLQHYTHPAVSRK